jgi:hypothetical protein
MTKSLFIHMQVRYSLYAVNNYSDSEYELLLIIQISYSYELNVIAPEASSLAKLHAAQNY